MLDAPTPNTDLDYADTLWKAADALRGQIDAAEYKHVVLSLLFLKYISDVLGSRRDQLCVALNADQIPEDQIEALPRSPDEYTAGRVFWVSADVIRDKMQAKAVDPKTSRHILAVEKNNPTFKNKLPRDYACRTVETVNMKGRIYLIATIGVKTEVQRASGTLGPVYEYFLGKFAAAESKLGGRFYKSRCVVGVLVEMREPITRAFGKTVGPLFNLIKVQSEESNKLAELCDYLPPRLLFGIVRVRPIE